MLNLQKHIGSCKALKYCC